MTCRPTPRGAPPPRDELAQEGVVDPIGAVVPLLTRVGSWTSQVVPHEIDERSLAARGAVGGLVRRGRRRVINGEPLAVGAGAAAAAAEKVLLVGGARVRRARHPDPLARERPQVGEVLRSAAFE